MRLRDIAWFAGLYEGEGSCYLHLGKRMRLSMGTTDEDVLRRVHGLFGGNVTGPYIRKTPAGNDATPIWHWAANGVRARGIAFTIYPLLGARRQAKIRECI